MHRILLVTSHPDGGVPQTNRDLMVALLAQGDVEVWHLSAVQRLLSLRRVLADGTEVEGEGAERHRLHAVVDAVTQHSEAYDRVVGGWLQARRFDVVHIRHLAWHALSLPRLAKAAGARVLLSLHDYYLLCPTVKLVNAQGHYCAGDCGPGAGSGCGQGFGADETDCRPEPMWPGQRLPRLRGQWVQDWRTKAAEALSGVDAFITTHDSVRELFERWLPLPAGRPCHVIAHGRDFPPLRWRGQTLKKGQKLKILLPGSLTPAKGLDIVRALAERDGGERLQFELLGSVSQPIDLPGVTVHGDYPREAFAERVEAIRPHLGAVFSIWNETWCHTLTELWSCGLPVMAFDFPTVGARIRESGAGWIWPLDSVEALYRRILALDFFELSRQSAHAAALQPILQQQNGAEMARRYRAAYGWSDAAAVSPDSP